MKKQQESGPKEWGEEWLAALVHPSKNAIWEQGAQYLEEGALQELTLTQQGMIETQVQDYGGRLYQQQLQAPAFSATQIQAWNNTLQQHPDWTSQLLSQQVPPTLFQIGRQLEASLLAPALEDWNLACSCPNRQVPCRHLTTVLLAIQEQIEQDPWWLFRLRGLSTKDLLEEEERASVLSTVDVFPSLEQQTISSEEPSSSSTVAYNSQLLQQLDWSMIENKWKDYLRLLDNQPLFDHQGTLKKQLQQQLRKARQCHKKQALDRADYVPWHQQLQQTKDIALIIDKKHQLLNVFVIQESGNQPLFASDRALECCIGLLETVDLKELPLYPEAFIALHCIYRFALKLLYEQAYLPYLLASPTGFLMQWLPAYTVDKTIQQLLVKLARYSPTDLLLLDDAPLKKLLPQKQILSLCHLVVSFYLQQAKEWIPEWNNRAQKITYCFFSGQPTPFEGSKEQSIPKSIRAWLQPFYLGQAQYAPVIKIVEVEEEGQERYFYSQLKVENRGDKTAPLVDLAKFLRQKDKKAYHLVVLQELQRLAPYYPDVAAMLGQQEPQSPRYTSVEFEWIFFEVLPLLQLLNIAIVLPLSLQRLTKPRLGMSIGTQEKKTSKKPSFVSLKNLLKVEWKVAVGDEMIEAVEFLKLMKQKNGLVRYKERYLYLDEAELIKILEQLETPPPAAANQLLQAALSHYGGDYQVEVSAGVKTLLEALQEPLVVAAPKTLKATLRPYQQVGYAWMYKNAELGLGSLIADDMGLGKTLQVIALLLKFKEEGRLEDKKALVVVPTSLLTNWRKEIQKFAPLLQARLYHGAKRQLSLEADVILTTYGVARMEMTRLNQLGWYCLIIDEAQAIKNVQAGQTTAIKALKADLKIAMSGTPVENRLAEYWSIMDFVNPNYLGTMGEFTEAYSQPIEQDNDQQRLDAFRKVTAPFILRRLKSDKSIIQDLPDKIEQNYLATLQPMQAELYQKIVNDSLAELQLYKKEPKKRQGLLLKLMGALKQISNHPYQYLQSGGSGPVYSGKSQLLMDLLTRIDRQQEKVLLFTQYRKMGRLIKGWIKERFGKEPMYLHGGCSRAERDAMVEAFQTDKQERIFLLSLKAAGTGLNLTAANHVIHYDLWWNPAVEAQATDRAYRIGQQKNVQVYRFITQGTLEEKIDAMIQSKKDLADRTVTLGEQWLGDLSNEELEDLLRLG
ncbi:MAG: SNF2-related protein [Aureispira sp.]